MASIREKLLEAIKAGKPEQVRAALKTADGSTPLRSATGESPLHEAVRLCATPEVFNILLEGIADFSARNIDGQTVADLVFSAKNLDPDYETILVNHVKAWILRGRVDELEKLLLSGWVFWPVSVDQAKNVSAELCDFVSKIRDVQVCGSVNPVVFRYKLSSNSYVTNIGIYYLRYKRKPTHLSLCIVFFLIEKIKNCNL